MEVCFNVSLIKLSLWLQRGRPPSLMEISVISHVPTVPDSEVDPC